MFFIGLEKKIRPKKISVTENFLVGRKKIKKMVENFFESEKILVDIFWSVEKKSRKKIVNFGVSLTFFVVDHFGRPGRNA